MAATCCSTFVWFALARRWGLECVQQGCFKMASTKEELLSDLGFSEESLEISSRCGIHFYELLMYTADDFRKNLNQTNVAWSCEAFYDFVQAWRTRNKLTISKVFLSDLTAPEIPVAVNSGQASQISGQIETDKDRLPSDADTDSSASDEDFDGGNIKQSSEDKHPTEIQPDVVDGASGSQIKQRETIPTPSFLQSPLEATEEGKAIIEQAQIGELSDEKQLQLAGTIARFHLEMKKITHGGSRKLFVSCYESLQV
ncbi:uncharacterized protein LOC129729021 isoform X2 [Wyeomyia smithii]|uniref:uncharacterized protein LOC129729021 isoform X2 n=1 Tax=Wyeomyia smithii TaxID=174621 RepID=UPI0024681C05|nr:uncharacterized protein LOC129729021 isoform X2 [Wyeomyia smithii]